MGRPHPSHHRNLICWVTSCHRIGNWHVCAQSLSRAWLFATRWTIVRQTPLPMEFSRQKYWNGFPFPPPGHLPEPEIEPASPALAGRFFITEPLRKPIIWNGSSWSQTSHLCSQVCASPSICSGSLLSFARILRWIAFCGSLLWVTKEPYKLMSLPLNLPFLLQHSSQIHLLK